MLKKSKGTYIRIQILFQNAGDRTHYRGVPNDCFSPFFYLFIYHGRKIINSLFGWMDSLRFYIRFNGILVISGRWAGDNEKFCAMESRYD